MNPDVVPELEKAGLRFVGKDDTNTRMEIGRVARTAHRAALHARPNSTRSSRAGRRTRARPSSASSSPRRRGRRVEFVPILRPRRCAKKARPCARIPRNLRAVSSRSHSRSIVTVSARLARLLSSCGLNSSASARESSAAGAGAGTRRCRCWSPPPRHAARACGLDLGALSKQGTHEVPARASRWRTRCRRERIRSGARSRTPGSAWSSALCAVAIQSQRAPPRTCFQSAVPRSPCGLNIGTSVCGRRLRARAARRRRPADEARRGGGPRALAAQRCRLVAAQPVIDVAATRVAVDGCGQEPASTRTLGFLDTATSSAGREAPGSYHAPLDARRKSRRDAPAKDATICDRRSGIRGPRRCRRGAAGRFAAIGSRVPHSRRRPRAWPRGGARPSRRRSLQPPAMTSGGRGRQLKPWRSWPPSRGASPERDRRGRRAPPPRLARLRGARR